jgi:hypothetical protein
MRDYTPSPDLGAMLMGNTLNWCHAEQFQLISRTGIRDAKMAKLDSVRWAMREKSLVAPLVCAAELLTQGERYLEISVAMLSCESCPIFMGQARPHENAYQWVKNQRCQKKHSESFESLRMNTLSMRQQNI